MDATFGDETTESVRRKAERLARGYSPRVLDVFAGCGGMSLGFQSVGCEIVAALEVDKHAAASHTVNFFRDAPQAIRELHTKPRDITAVEPEEVCNEFGLGPVGEAVDVIIGGPPCQAYARVGRAKLREVAEHPEAFKIDPRANLYLRYLHYVERMKPLAIMMENVPDLMNFGGHNLAQEIAEALERMGYVARYSLVNAVFYGVPQLRDRVILLAVRKELGVTPPFAVPTHHMRLPSGYEGTRTVACKSLNRLLRTAYVDAPRDDTKPAPITAAEAIGDLPPIILGSMKGGAKRFDTLTPYDASRSLSAYATLMRKWSGFENDEGVRDHVIRNLPRDGPIFCEMPQGAEYPEAHRIAARLFQNEVRRRSRMNDGPIPQAEWCQLREKMVPPYSTETFPNKWWKLRADFPSRTLMAHLGKDSYSHIHYDSEQARVISVREAARLQSFPDGFVFCGTMNPAYKQIGNAVPPLLAKAMGEVLLAAVFRATGRLPAVAA